MIKSGYNQINESINYKDMYASSAKKVYDNLDDEALSKYLTKDIIKNPAEVCKVVKQWTTTCYIYCGYVARIMDYYGIKYKCYTGIAIPPNSKKISKEDADKIKQPNHAWIECNGRFYELFNGSSSRIEHLKILSEIKF